MAGGPQGLPGHDQKLFPVVSWLHSKAPPHTSEDLPDVTRKFSDHIWDVLQRLTADFITHGN